jgi:hypothetical protein
MSKKWKKEKAIEGEYGGCLNCGPRPSFFHRRMRIGVGFGYAALERDGKTVWSEVHDTEWEKCMTGQKAENIAAKDPNHDWRIVLHGPLSGRVYQRHEKGKWALIQQDGGFA